MIGVGGEGVDQPGHGRVGGDRAEHARFGPEHANIGQAVTTKRQRQREIEHDLARIVHRQRLAPRPQRRRETTIDPDGSERFDQHHTTGLTHRRRACGVDVQTRIQPGIVPHLESAPRLDWTDPLARSIKPGQEHFSLHQHRRTQDHDESGRLGV
jgi:hypothetical protein